MLSLLLKMTLRRLSREKVYVITNIFSLSLAMACCLIILAFVRNELSYDEYNADAGRMGRVGNQITTNGQTSSYALTSRALGPLLINAYPHLGEYVRFRNLVVVRNLLKYEDTKLYWDDILLADENVFEVFSHSVVYGSVKGALADPSSIAISQSMARAYFGEQNPIGKTLSTDTFSYKITLVFKDLPQSSHLKYSALLSMNRLKVFGLSDDNLSPQMLFGADTYTYFRVNPGVDMTTFEATLDSFYQNMAAKIGKQVNVSLKFIVQPLTTIHFDNRFNYDQPTGNIFYVYGFIAVGIFMLVVASINYTNLATARAVKRAKEVGMTKIIGAEQSQLIVQHLGEAFAFTFVALLLGLGLVELIDAYTPMRQLLGKASLLDLGADPLLIVVAIGTALIMGLLSGAYPAFYLSGISPLSAISLHVEATTSRMSLSRILVFVQFLVSIAVVIVTILMTLQMHYVSSKPLGFERDNKIVVTLRGVDILNKMEVMKNILLRKPGIKGVTVSAYVPGVAVNATLRQLESEQGQMEVTSVNQILTGRDFVSVMGIEIAKGRDFSMRLLTDVGTSILVNQILVKKMGWTDPIGKKIGPGNGRVIGVIKDFHFDSLHEPVNPMILRQFPTNSLDIVPDIQRNLISRYMIVNIDPDKANSAVDAIESVVAQFDPGHPFEYQYMQDLLNELYESESNQIKLLGAFATVCILISCLGLAGLAAFATEQRSKEISIRKVLGASSLDIIRLIISSFVLLILGAAVVASVLSYMAMNRWLMAFAYHADIALWVFPLSSALIALFAFSTIVLQSWKTAITNPVKVLRYE